MDSVWTVIARAHCIRAVTCGVLLVWMGGCDGPTPGPRNHAKGITVLVPSEIQDIDPRFAADAYSLKVSRLLFSSLLSIDPHTLAIVPDLAEEVTVLGAQTYRVRLRKGLRFSDGSLLTSQDVIATYHSVTDPELKSRYAQTYRRIRAVTALDLYTVVFELTETHATFITDLELPILSRHYRHKRITMDMAAQILSSGAYTLCAKQQNVLSLCRNPHWHKGKARAAHVRLMVVRDDNTRAMRLLAGAADLALNAVPPLLVPLFERDSQFKVMSSPGVGTTYMGVRTDQAMLSDPRIRQAIAYAIDRVSLIRAKFGGRASIARGFIPEGHWAYDKALPLYAYQPERARMLIDYARRDGVEFRRLRLRTSADRLRLSIGRAIAAMLHDVGIDVDVWPSETATLLDDLREGRYDLAILALPEVYEPHVLSWFFGSDHIPSKTTVGANRWRYRNPRLDGLFAEGVRHTDLEERRAVYDQVQQILAKNLPAIPLWHEDNVAVVRTRSLPYYRVPRDGRFGTLATP